MKSTKQNNIGEKIGLFLKYERMNKSISISKISEDLNLSPSTIVSIENNKHHASFINVFLIIAYLGIDITDFWNHLNRTN